MVKCPVSGTGTLTTVGQLLRRLVFNRLCVLRNRSVYTLIPILFLRYFQVSR